jgi:hypothetical protein
MFDILLKIINFLLENWKKLTPVFSEIGLFLNTNILIISIFLSFCFGIIIVLLILKIKPKKYIEPERLLYIEFIDENIIYRIRYIRNELDYGNVIRTCEKCLKPLNEFEICKCQMNDDVLILHDGTKNNDNIISKIDHELRKNEYSGKCNIKFVTNK